MTTTAEPQGTGSANQYVETQIDGSRSPLGQATAPVIWSLDTPAMPTGLALSHPLETTGRQQKHLANRTRPCEPGQPTGSSNETETSAITHALHSLNGRDAFHDIRQPLAAVLILAEAALAEPALPPIAGLRLHQIVEQAEWLRDMIDQWLRLGQPVGGGALTDLVRVVNDAAAAQRAIYEGELDILWPATAILTPVEQVIVRRVIANLLSNATRAAGPVGRVAVEVDSVQDWARVIVEDTGPGFGRIQGGLGLGLTTSARNVADFGGKLECGRGRLGGARVTVWLPRSR